MTSRSHASASCPCRSCTASVPSARQGEQRGVNRRRGRDDVTRGEPRAVVARPVGDDTPGLAHEERAGGDVPGTERLLEVPVEHAGRSPRQIEARRTGAAEALETTQGTFEDREVLTEAVGLGPEGKARRADRAIYAAPADGDGLVVAERPAPGECGVGVPEQRRVHDADDGDAESHERNRDADDGKAVEEVGRPVQRVDEPAHVAAPAAALLPEDRKGWGGAF